MNFNFKKYNAWDFIGSFLLYAIITFFYYALDPKSESQSKIAKLNRVLHSIIDEFGLDLPAWLQILLFFILFVFFIELFKFTYKQLISLFKKK